MKISVVIPVYKVEESIRKCIDSIMAQDYPDYEIVLVDDGSPDRCGEICDEYAAGNMCIQVIHQKNSGVSAARNAGMSAAKGDYITFIDPDDWVENKYLTVLEKNMMAGGLSVCGYKSVRDSFPVNIEEDNEVEGKKIVFLNKIETQKAVLMRNGESIAQTVWCKLFDKKVIDQYNIRFLEDVPLGEDTIFLMKYISCASQCTAVSQEKLYYYREKNQIAVREGMKKINNKLFITNKYIHEIENTLICDKDIDMLWKANVMIVRINDLHWMIITKREKSRQYGEYVQILRKYFPICFSLKNHIKKTLIIKIALCMISPKLEYMLWCLGKYMEERFYGRRGYQ